jgi:thiopurine S-methyltransferase
MDQETEEYWTTKYITNTTGWDIGYPSDPIKSYIDQLTDKNVNILIPGAGNAYEAEYLLKSGFNHLHILDISEIPLQKFKDRNPSFPIKNLIHDDFFTYMGEHELILEQTFFCSFPPTKENRTAYFKQMARLLTEKGKLAGVWFDFPKVVGDMINRPFGGNKEEYMEYLAPYFEIHTLAPCYNSIAPRSGKELFGILLKK